MKKLKWTVVFSVSAMMGLLPVTTFAESIQSCGSSSTKTGMIYKINGSENIVRNGPSTKSSKIVNQASTDFFKKTHYITIGNSGAVYEECTQGEWSKIRVTDPSYLSQSHRGWVPSKILRSKKVDSSGVEVFVEADFSFDKKETPYKSLIISRVNEIHRKNSKCKNIDPSSAGISRLKGSEKDPVFYVVCGKGATSFNVYFLY